MAQPETGKPGIRYTCKFWFVGVLVFEILEFTINQKKKRMKKKMAKL